MANRELRAGSKWLLEFSMFWMMLATAKVGVAQVEFVKLASWNEVVQKARMENKGIFVDFYATWCGPCKYMDQHIYADTTVGVFYNAKYVSIRVQCDTGKKDDAYVKSWYSEVGRFIREFRISAYPCLMYFSPDGLPLHVTYGMREVADFIKQGTDALKPDRQYFTLLRKFQAGGVDTSTVRRLMTMADAMGDTAVGRVVTKYYVDTVLWRLPKAEIMRKEDLRFMTYAFTRRYIGSEDRAFDLLYTNQAEINRVMEDSSFSRRYIDFVVSVEYLDPVLSKLWATTKQEPDWKLLTARIEARFPREIARKVVEFGKDRWYSTTKNWKKLRRIEDYLLRYYGGDVDDFALNNKAWAVFEECSDRNVVKSAIGWSARVLRDTVARHNGTGPNYIDTYANLLYKAGKVKEALYWERQACGMEPKNAEFQERLHLMQLGEPTWKNA